MTRISFTKISLLQKGNDKKERRVALAWLILAAASLGVLILIVSSSYLGAKQRQSEARDLPRKGGQEQAESQARSPQSPASELPRLSTPEPSLDPSDWKTYRNEEYGFELKYPAYLNIGERPGQKPFTHGLKGSRITTFSYERIAELGIFVSQGSLDRYVIVDRSGGISYRFDQKANLWIPSESGHPTEREPRLLDTPATAYMYASGDSVWGWQNVVIPHPSKDYVLGLTFSRNVEEELQPEFPGYIRDVASIINTFRFTAR